MSYSALALITSYLDARQRRKEWQAPWLRHQLAALFFDYSIKVAVTDARRVELYRLEERH